MSKRVMAMLAGVVALAMFMAACGGGSDEEALTKAEFIKQGDQVCKEATAQVATGYKEFAKEKEIKTGEFPTQKQGFEIAEAVYLPSVEEKLEGLQELTPPEADEETIDKMLTSTEDGLEKAEENIKLLFMPGKVPFDEANKIAKEYGFKVCGTS